MPSSFAIGKHFEHFIRSQVEGGRYASASELESGQGAPADQVFDRLEEKYSNLARGRE